MSNNRLNYLAIMYSESGVLNNICLDNIITEFANKKSRNKV